MRCLYCNKKLSLLKLAKGDSFCSPEHFDAHQLKLSKDAIERLMSVPAEESPKAPLVVQQPEEVVPAARESTDEKAALARLTAFAPSPAAPEPEAFQPPPYAPFAVPELSSWPLNPQYPIVNGPEGSQSVEPDREPAMPVHAVGETAGMLNLYLRLSLAGKEPMSWTSERRPAVAPEEFNLEIKQPPIGFMPEFIEIENAVLVAQPEVSEPVEPVLPVEADLPVAADPSVDTAPVIEAMAIEEPIPPPASTAIPIEPSSVTPIQVATPRLPFLLAPSFQEREGVPIILHNAASAIPNELGLAPILDKEILPRIDSCDVIPNSLRVAGNKGFRLIDSKENRINGASELPTEQAFVLPEANAQVCGDAWVPSDRRMAISQQALESGWESTRAVDFELPVPASLLLRPDAGLLGEVDPQQLLAGAAPLDTKSLFLGILETRPLGREPLSADLPPVALKYVWQATLAPFPDQERLAAPWQYRTAYFSLPDPMSAGYRLPMVPLEAFPYGLACAKVDRIEKAELPAPYVAKDFYFPMPWPGSDCTSAPFLSEPGLAIAGSTMLPQVAAVPPGRLKRGQGDATLQWEPKVPASPASALAKFLPIRDGAILPAAKSWPRLESVPR